MRNIVLFTPALLMACAAVPADPPVHGVTPGHKCQIEGTKQFVGHTRSDATGDAIKKASNAAVLRWAPPGYAMTMDYREDRVTVYLDDAGKITKINCG
jgi:hypothetical protein